MKNTQTSVHVRSGGRGESCLSGQFLQKVKLKQVKITDQLTDSDFLPSSLSLQSKMPVGILFLGDRDILGHHSRGEEGKSNQDESILQSSYQQCCQNDREFSLQKKQASSNFGISCDPLLPPGKNLVFSYTSITKTVMGCPTFDPSH